MNPKEEPRTRFLGTYFDRSRVLRLSRWLIVLGWIILAAYLLEFGYTTYQNISSAIVNAYPIDIAFLVLSLKSPLQGLMLFGILFAASQVLLILLDIEDNTREARPR
jgi:hypothetical protein